MSLKEMVIQEIENASEPLLKEVLEFIHSHQDPLIAHLNQLREQGEYADDVSEDELNESDSAYKSYLEGNEKGTTLDNLEIELFGEKL
ncbi:hypothetical protein [Altericista sp. CCNU0014]|uniref:hypothetical protein n=1 Tax=Altericista sp. CCNU0014 TaxID=3082949 RepID=UPI003851127D